MEADTEKGLIVIRPVKIMHNDQEYFQTKEWQVKEAVADQDIAKGDLVGPFSTAKAALRALKNR